MKTCTQCSEVKVFDNFYVCGKNRLGEPRYNPRCRDCCSRNYRGLYNKDESFRAERVEKNRLGRKLHKYSRKDYAQTQYATTIGRARAMLKSAKRREHKGSEFNLDLDFILEKLDNGVCEVTGIPFSYDKPDGVTCNKFSPSLDRVDNNIGYIKSNVRVVVWQYNLMKGQITDYELLEICQAVVNKHRGD